MEQLPVTKFKATCLAVMERVNRTGQPVRITRFGRPVVDVVPTAPQAPKERVFGALANRTRIKGDIISPAVEPEEWEVLR
jgi:prevent-host-death family protein